jgi:hypothetical protein
MLLTQSAKINATKTPKSLEEDVLVLEAIHFSLVPAFLERRLWRFFTPMVRRFLPFGFIFLASLYAKHTLARSRRTAVSPLAIR